MSKHIEKLWNMFCVFFFGTTKSNTAILPLLPYRCGNENRIYVRECICVREYKCVCMYVYVLCIPHALGKKWHIKKHRGNYTSIASCKATLERDKMTEWTYNRTNDEEKEEKKTTNQHIDVQRARIESNVNTGPNKKNPK